VRELVFLFSEIWQEGLVHKNQEIEEEKYKLRPDTIIVAGSSRLPENITAKHVFGFFTIELEIDPVDSKIVDVSCSILPFLGEKIIYNALLGNEVKKGIEIAIQQLERRFFSVTKRAIIAALEDAYKMHINGIKNL